MQVVIIQDTREQAPLKIEAYPVEVDALPVGDYGIKGFSDWDNPEFIVERKSLDDLAGSLGHGRERFMREVKKLRQFRFASILIEAERIEAENHQYKSSVHENALLASLKAIQVDDGIHIIWAGDRMRAARYLEGLVRQFARRIHKRSKLLGVSA